MCFLKTILCGHLTAIILITSIVVLVLRKQIYCGIRRQDWALLVVVSSMSLLAIAFIWLFNYYHWRSGIVLMDRFRPNIDMLKLCNVACGCLSIGMTMEILLRKSFRAGIIGIMAALPGAVSLLIYG